MQAGVSEECGEEAERERKREREMGKDIEKVEDSSVCSHTHILSLSPSLPDIASLQLCSSSQCQFSSASHRGAAARVRSEKEAH